MADTKLTLIVATVYGCLLCFASAKNYPYVYDLSFYCGSTIYVKNDVRITLSSTNTQYGNEVCKLTIVPQTGGGLVATFLNYSVPDYRYYSNGDNCQYESIQLTADGADKFPYRGYCRRDMPDGQYYLGRFNSFQVSNFQYYSLFYPTIDILFTEVSYKQYNGCPYQMFDCQRQDICVDDSITCNGYNDCGNNLDETQGCREPGPNFDITTNIPVVVGVSVGLFVFIVIVTVVIVVACKRRGKAAYIQF